MVNYTESATLRVIDKSSKPIGKINKKLDALLSSAKDLNKAKLSIKGLTKATSDADKLRRSIMALPRSRTINVKVNFGSSRTSAASLKKQLDLLTGRKASFSVTSIGLSIALSRVKSLNAQLTKLNGRRISYNVNGKTTGGGTTGPRAATPRGGYGGGILGGGLGAISTTPFPGNIPSAFNFTAAMITVHATRAVIRSATNATLEKQTEETSQDLIFYGKPAVKALIDQAASSMVSATDGITLTRANKMARDMYVTGYRGETFEKLAPVLATYEAAALAYAPDKADQLTALLNKMGNLGAVTEDPERAAAILSGVFKGAMAQGETFNPETYLGVMRVSGVAQRVNEAGAFRIAQASDELGKRVGSGLQRFTKVLTTDSRMTGQGVAKGIMETLVRAGLRDEEGNVVQEQLMYQNPLKWIEDVLGGRLRAKGLDVRGNAEDRIEAEKLVKSWGFVGAELKMIMNELSAGAERDKAIELFQNFDPGKLMEAAADDLGFQMRNLSKQFQSFAAEGLDPLFAALAPITKSLADTFKMLAIDDGPNAQLKRLGFVAATTATAIGGLVGTSMLLKKMFGGNGLNKSAALLDKSALDISAAAARLGAGGAGKNGTVVAPPGKTPPKTAPGKLGTGPGAMIAGYVAVMEAGNASKDIWGDVTTLFSDRATKLEAMLESENRKLDNVFTTIPLFGGMYRDQIEKNIAGFERLLAEELAKTAPPTIPEKASAPDSPSSWPWWNMPAEKPTTPASVGKWTPPAGSEGLQDELVAINTKLASSFNPNSAATLPDKIRKQELLTEMGMLNGDELLTVFNAGTSELETAFAMGSEQVKQVGPTLDEAAMRFGPAAALGFEGYAPTIGAAMAQAFSAAVGTLNINATATAVTEEPMLGNPGIVVPL